MIALRAGAAGSVALTFWAGRQSPQHLLIVLIAGWVLAPFAALVVAHVVSTRWAPLTRTALYGVTLVVSLGSLAVYVHDVLRPPKAQAAAVFVAVPAASWLLIAIVVPMAAFISRRKHAA